MAAQHGYVIVPPYNDEQIIAGQGTTGLEILQDSPDVDLVLVSTGGGGLISGVSAALNWARSQAKIVGVEPELANDSYGRPRQALRIRPGDGAHLKGSGP